MSNPCAIQVVFTPTQETEIARTVTARLQSKAGLEQGLPHNAPFAGLSLAEKERVGVRGEMAVHLALGLPWPQAQKQQASDPGYDLKLFGLPIDVKTAAYLDGQLLIRTDAKLRAKVLILATTLTPSSVVVQGWLVVEDLPTLSTVTTMPSGPCYTLAATSLHPLRTLRAYCLGTTLLQWLYQQQPQPHPQPYSLKERP